MMKGSHMRMAGLVGLWGWLGPASIQADITVTIDRATLPVGGTAEIQFFLQPSSGPVAGMGATLAYVPSELEVSFAGAMPDSLGGPAQAVHLLHHVPGRITVGAARPLGSSHTAAYPEPFAHLHLRRLVGQETTLAVQDAYLALPGGATFQSAGVGDLVFAFIALDSDGDGIDDSWEFAIFGGLDIAGTGTDFDGDGESDLNEFQDGTDPRIAFLTSVPVLHQVQSAGQFRIQLTFPTEASVSYRLQTTGALDQNWSAGPFSSTMFGPANQTVVTGTGAEVTMFIDARVGKIAYYRLTVNSQ